MQRGPGLRAVRGASLARPARVAVLAAQAITRLDLVAYGPYLKDDRSAELGFHFRLAGAEAADNVPPWAVDRHHLYGDYPTCYTK